MANWKKYLRIIGGLVILTFVISRADFHSLTISWRPELVAGLALVTLCLFAAQGLSAYRWKVILGVGSPPWAFLFRLYLISAFFSLFLPTAVGGDAVRAVAATRAGAGTGRAVGGVVLDRTLGVAALLIFAVIGLAVSPPTNLTLGGAAGSHSTLKLAVLGVLAAAVVLGWTFRRRLGPVTRAAEQFRDLIVDLAREPGRFARALLVGLAVQGCYLLAWLVLGIALGLPIPPASHLVSVPIVSLSTMIPITLSGVGLREGAWTLLLARFGISSADAVAYSLLYFGCWMIVAGSGGVLFSVKGLEQPANGR